MYFTISVVQLLVYIVLLSYLPFVIEILLDRPVKEVNFTNHLRENEERFAQKLLRITSYWRSILILIFSVFIFCAIQALLLKTYISVLNNYHLTNIHVVRYSYQRRDIYLMFYVASAKVVPCTVYHQSSPSTVVCTYQNFFIILYKCRHQL